MNPESPEFKRLILQIEANLLANARLRILTESDGAAEIDDRGLEAHTRLRSQEGSQLTQRRR